MSRNKKVRALAFFLTLLALTGCSAGKTQEVELVSFAQSGESNETTGVVQRGTLSKPYSMSGYVNYTSAVLVRLKADGVVFEEMKVANGQTVQAGDELAVFSKRADNVRLEEIGLQLRQLDEQLSDSADERARQVKELDEQLEDIDNLLPRDYTYRDEVNRQIMERKKARIALEQQQLELQTAHQKQVLQKEQQEIEEGEQELVVTAPVDGVIANVQYISAGETCYKGQVLVAIYDPTQFLLMAEAGVTGDFRLGQSVEITYGRNNERKSVPGTVIYADSALPGSLQRGGSAVRIDGEVDPADLLNPSINSEVLHLENVLLLPRSAMGKDGGKAYVQLLDDDGTLRRRYILTGPQDADNIMVLAGADEGSRAVEQ